MVILAAAKKMPPTITDIISARKSYPIAFLASPF
jgi:hypothetical protein